MFNRIRWGIHPDCRKSATAGSPVVMCSVPENVIIPLRQHIGAPCAPLVKKGDTVKKGQVIASAEAPVSSPVHSSVSGTVTDIANHNHPVFGQCQAVFIANDGKEEWFDGLPLKRDWQTLDKAEILSIIRNAGIVGMGGAAFPSHLKLAPPPEKNVDTLVVNAAECEPFLTVDHRTMLEQSGRIAEGLKIILKVLPVKNVIIGIEDNKMDAVKKMQETFSGTDIKVVAVPTRYPQGAEKMLIKTLTGRSVRAGKLPMDVGVVVQNVSTAVAIADAVICGIPLIERLVTVSGGAVAEPKNLLVRIGTSFEHAIKFCGGFKGTPEKLIMGGPMMGIAQFSADVPVIKGSSGILALSRDDVKDDLEFPCIRCGKCVDNCPMGLNPGVLSILGEKEEFAEAKDKYCLMDCIECGCCSYGCPAKRKIVQYVRYLKKLNADKAAASKK